MAHRLRVSIFDLIVGSFIPTWALEFYVDIGNALVAAETFGEEDEDAPGYVLPMIGLRARF